MRKLFSLLTALLFVGSMWAGDVTGTINFGSADGSTAVNAKSVNGNDSQGNEWTITTVMSQTSFTQNAAYSQIGSSSKPATSITFTTTLSESKTIKAFSAKFGGFGSTAGNITLKVGNTTVGSGSLNETSDVTVSKTGEDVAGTVLTVTVTNIAKGVKVYFISYTYDDGGATLQTVTISGTPTTTTYEENNVFDVDGLTVTGNYSDESSSEISEGITWKARTNADSDDAVALAEYHLTKGQTSLQVQATVSTIASAWYTVSGLTVNEHQVTPGSYDIVPNTTFWGCDVINKNNATENEINFTGHQDDIAVTIKNGSKANAYINASQTRVYADGYTMKFDAPSGYVITAIAFTADGTYWAGTHTANVGDMTDNKNWAGSASSVTITFGGTCRITNMNVTYAAVPSVGLPTISGQTPFYPSTTVTMSIETDGAQIIYTTDGEDPIGGDNTYTTPIVITESTTYKARGFKGVELGEVVEKAFVKATPITVAAAQALIPNNNNTVDNAFVIGYVCTAGTSVSSGQMTYYISDNGATVDEGTETTDRLQIYKGKALNNTDFSDATDLVVGDKVVVYGQLKNFSGIYEFNSGNYIVEKVAKGDVASVAISGTATHGAYESGDDFDPAGLTVTATYASGYQVDVTASATWSLETITTQSGNTDVTASFGGKTSDAKTVNITLNTYAVTFSAPEHGTLAVKKQVGEEWVAITSGDKFVKGTTLKVEAEPENINYKLNTLNVNTSSGSEDILKSKEFTVGTLDITVIATFTLKPAATISWQSTDPVVRAIDDPDLLTYTTWQKLNNVGSFSVSVTSSNTDVIPSMQPYANSTNTTYWFPTSIAGTGTTTITATFAGNDNFRETSVSYDVTIKAASGLAWSAESADVRYGASNTYPTLTKPEDLTATITYSSTDETIATISNEEGHEGEITLKANGSTTIKASFVNDPKYADAEVSYTLNVSAGIVTVTPDDPVALDLGEVLYGDVAANYGKSFHLHITNLSPNQQIAVITHYSQCYASPKFYDANGEGVLDADVTILPITNLAPRENPYVDNIEVRCTGTREFADIVVGTASFVSVQAYAITATAENGTLTFNGAAAPKVAKQNTEFTLVATPASGYTGGTITVLRASDDKPVTEQVLDGNLLTMPDYAIKVTATFTAGGGTALDNAEAQEKAVKFIENNQIFIRRGDKTFNAQGQLVK